MKLVIQIPAYNEETTIGRTIADLPTAVAGIDAIEILVLDDGSKDQTARAAKEAGAHQVVRSPQNRGLARTFHDGLAHALRLGADIVVNTDADNQYRGEDIARLVEPIVAGRAEMVVGCRDMDAVEHFSPAKRFLQRLGSAVVRRFSGTGVPDATSGFRALSRRAASRLNVVSGYTYTLETLIQAGREGMAIEFIDITTNPKLRESRLIQSEWRYIVRSIGTLLRIFVLYEPFKAFLWAGVALIAPALLLGLRFLADYLTTGGAGKVQSLILAAILAIIGFQVIVLGVLADLLAANRRFLSELLERQRASDAGRPSPEDGD
ncbi:MAG: glycosyltransferase family 2 protein [Deltaproteobacteria bacterium]|nr:glycosyltransferase family 2 protein [Deltaproteobacteria bacterium]